MNSYVFTCGDTNGIGPEIVIKTINQIYTECKDNIILCFPLNIFENIIANIPLNFDYAIINDKEKLSLQDGKVKIYNIGEANIALGKPTKSSGKYSYISIKTAFELIQDNIADAMITAPISKIAIRMAGIDAVGHTEMLAKWCKVEDFVMTFLSESFHAALLTIHEPIKMVSQLITRKKFKSTLNVILDMMENDLGIEKPKIALLGVNPHAGEKGLIGSEEELVFKPVLKRFKNEKISGPFVPDAFFAKHLYENYDMVIGAYHDQILIPFKMLNFNSGVNYTAGLPIVRTSPDHGTAFDIADRYDADWESQLAAYRWAKIIVENRKRI